MNLSNLKYKRKLHLNFNIYFLFLIYFTYLYNIYSISFMYNILLKNFNDDFYKIKKKLYK